MSPAGVQNLQRLPFHEPHQPGQVLMENVQNWQRGLVFLGATAHDGTPAIIPIQSPALSLSDLSDTSTVRDYTEEEDACGTWLMSNPQEFRVDIV